MPENDAVSAPSVPDPDYISIAPVTTNPFGFATLILWHDLRQGYCSFDAWVPIPESWINKLKARIVFGF
jgi:hypothetical protein